MIEFITPFMLVAPPPPTGLTVNVSGSIVQLNWNNASDDQDIDFYRVAVYGMEGGEQVMLHESLEKDTSEQVSLYHTTGMLMASVSSCNRCGQMSRGSATESFRIGGKYNKAVPIFVV